MWLQPKEKKSSIKKALKKREKSKIEVRFKVWVTEEFKEKSTLLENSESAKEQLQDLVEETKRY